jgi:hypothetical protein
MTILETLDMLEARVAALEARATVETEGLATAESVSAVSDRVVVLETAVGTNPVVNP